jgi:hypothetical protein
LPNALGLLDQSDDQGPRDVDPLDDPGVNARIPERLRPAVNGDASPLRSGGIDQPVRIGANEFAQPFDWVLDPLRGGIQNRFAFVSVVASASMISSLLWKYP